MGSFAVYLNYADIKPYITYLTHYPLRAGAVDLEI